MPLIFMLLRREVRPHDGRSEVPTHLDEVTSVAPRRQLVPVSEAQALVEAAGLAGGLGPQREVRRTVLRRRGRERCDQVRTDALAAQDGAYHAHGQVRLSVERPNVVVGSRLD